MRDEEEQRNQIDAPFGGAPRPYSIEDVPRTEDGKLVMLANVVSARVSRCTTTVGFENPTNESPEFIRRLKIRGAVADRCLDHHSLEDIREQGVDLVVTLAEASDAESTAVTGWDPPFVGIGSVTYSERDQHGGHELSASAWVPEDGFKRLLEVVHVNAITGEAASLEIALSVIGFRHCWNRRIPLLVTEIALERTNIERRG